MQADALPLLAGIFVVTRLATPSPTGREAPMRWLSIDATAPDHLVVCFTHGLDLYVFEGWSELVVRRSGRLIAMRQVAIS